MPMETWSDVFEKRMGAVEERVLGLEERVETMIERSGETKSASSQGDRNAGFTGMDETNKALPTIIITALRKTVKEIAGERDFLKRENEELRLQNADLCERWVKATGSPVNPDELDARQFVQSFNALALSAFKGAVDRGFWASVRNQGEVIALMHSELSEALEAIRHDNPPDGHIPDFSGAEAELADCIIRIMDAAAGFNWRVAEAVVAKMEYNRGRPFKHGKEF